MFKRNLIAIALLVTGCAPSYPQGMNEAQWKGLSPMQQQQALALQHQQDVLAQQQFEAAMRQQQEQQIADERERLEANVRQRLGITQTEWMNITPDKKLELRQQQEAIERENREKINAAAASQERADAIRERNRQTLYTNSAYGTVVNCDISGGNAKFSSGFVGSKWAPLAPVRFSVAKGDALNVPIRRNDKQSHVANFWVGFSPNDELEFCADENTDKRYKRCRTHPVGATFQQGYTAPLSIPDAIDGATLSCRFAPGRH